MEGLEELVEFVSKLLENIKAQDEGFLYSVLYCIT